MLVMITVTHNSSKYIKRLVESIERSTVRPSLWIFVDSGSEDRTVQLLNDISANIPYIKVICLRRNAGYSSSVNIAVRELVRADPSEDLLLLVCNADGYFERNSLEKIISCAGNGITQPMILRADGGIDSAGNLMSLSGVVCPSQSIEMGFFYLSGACFLIPLRVYLDIGGMDSDIFLGADDLDLSWRAMLRGFELRICHNAIFFHHGGREISPKKMEYRVYSLIWTMAKCLPLHLMPAILASISIHLFASLLLSIYRRTPLYVLSVVKAVIKVLKNGKLLLRKRHHVRSRKLVRDEEILRRMTPTGLVLKIAMRRYLSGVLR